MHSAGLEFLFASANAFFNDFSLSKSCSFFHVLQLSVSFEVLFLVVLILLFFYYYYYIHLKIILLINIVFA
jgi:hypothetical protein